MCSGHALQLHSRPAGPAQEHSVHAVVSAGSRCLTLYNDFVIIHMLAAAMQHCSLYVPNNRTFTTTALDSWHRLLSMQHNPHVPYNFCRRSEKDIAELCSDLASDEERRRCWEVRCGRLFLPRRPGVVHAELLPRGAVVDGSDALIQRGMSMMVMTRTLMMVVVMVVVWQQRVAASLAVLHVMHAGLSIAAHFECRSTATSQSGAAMLRPAACESWSARATRGKTARWAQLQQLLVQQHALTFIITVYLFE